MQRFPPPYLNVLFAAIEGVDLVAQDLVREARKRMDKRKARSGRGGTMRPSAETPLWNAVVAIVRPRLRRRGDRALLARELGLHRARIGEFFGRQTAMPDAERTLLLLLWLSRQGNQAHPRRGRAKGS